MPSKRKTWVRLTLTPDGERNSYHRSERFIAADSTRPFTTSLPEQTPNNRAETHSNIVPTLDASDFPPLGTTRSAQTTPTLATANLPSSPLAADQGAKALYVPPALRAGSRPPTELCVATGASTCTVAAGTADTSGVGIATSSFRPPSSGPKSTHSVAVVRLPTSTISTAPPGGLKGLSSSNAHPRGVSLQATKPAFANVSKVGPSPPETRQQPVVGGSAAGNIKYTPSPNAHPPVGAAIAQNHVVSAQPGRYARVQLPTTRPLEQSKDQGRGAKPAPSSLATRGAIRVTRQYVTKEELVGGTKPDHWQFCPLLRDKPSLEYIACPVHGDDEPRNKVVRQGFIAFGIQEKADELYNVYLFLLAAEVSLTEGVNRLANLRDGKYPPKNAIQGPKLWTPPVVLLGRFYPRHSRRGGRGSGARARAADEAAEAVGAREWEEERSQQENEAAEDMKDDAGASSVVQQIGINGPPTNAESVIGDTVVQSLTTLGANLCGTYLDWDRTINRVHHWYHEDVKEGKRESDVVRRDVARRGLVRHGKAYRRRSSR